MKHPQIAEEAVQDGFIKIFKKLSSYDKEKSQVKTWMSTILVRICLDKLKLKSESFNATMEDLTQAQNVELDCHILSDFDLLNSIKAMPKGYRTIFNLYAVEGYDHNEIGQLLDIKSSTSRSQYYRAKHWLRKSLESSKITSKWTRVN